MQISITARHMEVTDAIRDYCHDKIVDALSDFPRTVSVHLILDVEKYRHIAEVVLHGVHHADVEAKAESDDMYASIDSAMEKAMRQLRKLRDKIVDHKREKLGHLEVEASRGPEPVME
jgi:putative sigma-54 modulation protein